ncbi:hypothetical protein Bca4012_021047 [Brassica carinata]|uniref:Uncharacterized protein n=1 Tax=Brassica carinata TaxID=52824 RepID=A0A8X7WGM2_BRACI|nr:hypothetical protein Bca52824_000569 [Brassica carinata]
MKAKYNSLTCSSLQRQLKIFQQMKLGREGKTQQQQQSGGRGITSSSQSHRIRLAAQPINNKLVLSMI